MRDAEGPLEATIGEVRKELRDLSGEMREIKCRSSQLATGWLMRIGGTGLSLAAFGFAFDVSRYAVPH